MLLSEVDEQVRQALSIQPSPEFARKVQARIERDRIQRDWPVWRWTAAAACVLAIVIGWRVANRTDDGGLAQIGHERSGTDVRLAAAPTPAPGERPTSVPRPARAIRTSRPPAHSQQEVLVPEDNARAVSRLLTLARSGSITEERLTPVAAPVSPPTLDVPPLGVAEIPALDLEIQNGPPLGEGRQE